MKTRGINSEEEILKHRTKKRISNQVMNELFMKGMIRSCYTYGGAERGSYNFETYIKPYQDKLPIEVFNEVYEEQTKYLSQFEVQTNVYTDSEGLNYNSLVEKKVV